MKRLGILSLFIFSIFLSKAQEFEDLKKEAEKRKETQKANRFDWVGDKLGQTSGELSGHRVLSFSIFNKISTNGSAHKKTSNNLSLNIVQGYNGALTGFEVGVLANIQDRYARGFQAAGLANIAGAEQAGIQVSGLANIAGGVQNGIQVGGLTNIAGGLQAGFQIAGLSNVAGGASYGMQVGGLTNITGGVAKGIQVASIANITGGLSYGIFISGLVNITGGVTRGLTIASLANITGAKTQGINIAGLTNVCSYTQGIQIAGLYNQVEKASGLLIAPINKIDSLNGCLPIGLITIVKNDRLRQFELSISNFMHTQLAFRNGGRKWYNIYSFGFQADDSNRWGFGLGFGSQLYMNSSKKLFANIEATCMGIYEGEWEMEKLNLNNQLRLAIGKGFGNWQAFVAADFNVLVSEYSNGEEFAPAAPSYSLYEHKPNSGAHVRVWPSGTLGIRYSFGVH